MINKDPEMERKKNYFNNLGYQTISGPNWFIVVPREVELQEKANKLKRKYGNKKCAICGAKYVRAAPRQSICGCCKLFIKCKQRDKIFEKINITNDIVEAIKRNKPKIRKHAYFSLQL